MAGPSGRTRITELNDVSCATATSCTAAGDYDYYPAPAGPLVEVWNGRSWSVTPAPRPSGGYGQLFGVSCTSATVCTAVGADQRAVTIPLVEVR